MFVIKTSSRFINEKRYVFDWLFRRRLGLEFKVQLDESIPHYEIIFNNKILRVSDHFFSLAKTDYYKSRVYLPCPSDYKEICGIKTPCLYGSFAFSKHDEDNIYDFDIFASVFFMLSRWEEYRAPEDSIDKFGRSIESNHLSVALQFDSIPVCDIWVEEFKLIISDFFGKMNFKTERFDYLITHDVDLPFLFSSRWNIFKRVLKHIFKFQELKKYIVAFIRFPEHGLFDPLDKYDFLMQVSESVKKKSIFYFKIGGTNKYDFSRYYNSSQVVALVKKVLERNHQVGLHPSFNTSDNKELLKSEVKKLGRITGDEVVHSRQHFLKFKLPMTFRWLDELGVQIDSSIAYSENGNFRSGTCHEYKVFDFEFGQELNLLERPISVMENNIFTRFGHSKELVYSEIYKIIKLVRKFNGCFVLLWHNHLLEGYEDVYKRVVQELNE